MPTQPPRRLGNGIPALARCTKQHETSLKYSLHFKHKKATQETSIFLVYSIQSKDFVIEYNFANLSNTTRLSNEIETLSEEFKRQKSSATKTLMLVLEESSPTTIWCTHTEEPIDSLSNPDDYRQLLSLAKSEEVYITFDYNWLHRDLQSTFCSFIKKPKDFKRFPIEKWYPGYKYKMLLISCSSLQAPPPYKQTKKRTSSDVIEPYPKRFFPASPTERASSTELETELEPTQNNIETEVHRIMMRDFASVMNQLLTNMLTLNPSSNPSISDSIQNSLPPELARSLADLLTTRLNPHLERTLEEFLSYASRSRERMDYELCESWNLATVDLENKQAVLVEQLEAQGAGVLEKCVQETKDISTGFEAYLTEQGDKVLDAVQSKFEKWEEFMCKNCRKIKPIQTSRRGVRRWGKGGYMGVRDRLGPRY